MVKKLFFVLFAVLVANADEIPERKLSDFVVKDLNGDDFSFEKLEAQCILVINTASRYSLSNLNMKYIENLKTKYLPDLQIVAFPSDSFGNEPKENEELKKWFTKWRSNYHVMEKTDVLDNEFFNFLKNSTNDIVNEDFSKFLIEKDGQITKYSASSSVFESNKLNEHVKRCVEAEDPRAPKKISDLVVTDHDGNEFSFEKFENKCVLVVNTASECGFTDVNMNYLNELTDLLPELQIVAFPSDSFHKEKLSNQELNDWFFKEWQAEYYVMEKTDIFENNVYKFLIDHAGDKNVTWDFNKYVIQKDGETVRYFNSKTGSTLSTFPLFSHLENCVNS